MWQWVGMNLWFLRRIWRSFNHLILTCMILQSTSSLLSSIKAGGSGERCMASGGTDSQATDHKGKGVRESCQQVYFDGSEDGEAHP